jgi:hypothetical protein
MSSDHQPDTERVVLEFTPWVPTDRVNEPFSMPT